MRISSISVNSANNRKNMFIKYSNSFMSTTSNTNEAIEKAQKVNPTINKSMGIETLTIFPKQVIDGKTIITA